MVKKFYECDVCHQKSMPAPDSRLVGFEWKAGSNAPDTIRYVNARQSERHICTDCLKGMLALAIEARKNGHAL